MPPATQLHQLGLLGLQQVYSYGAAYCKIDIHLPAAKMNQLVKPNGTVAFGSKNAQPASNLP